MERDRSSPPKKEKRGLMSRKLMLLRSRTASDRPEVTGRQDNTGRQDFPVRTDSLEDTSTIPSSPTIYSSDHLAPQSVGKRSSISGSSLNSDDYGALPAFLSRHRSREDTESEDTDTEKPAGIRMGYSVSIAGGSDVQRRTREEEEQNSAMLSQRAEQILANAKKRLNLMEGNLRGARDLVTPLTAANLKRATSLGSSAALQPAANDSSWMAIRTHDLEQAARCICRLVRLRCGGTISRVTVGQIARTPYQSDHTRLLLEVICSEGKAGSLCDQAHPPGQTCEVHQDTIQ
jgi:hypothetical protein